MASAQCYVGLGDAGRKGEVYRAGGCFGDIAASIHEGKGNSRCGSEKDHVKRGEKEEVVMNRELFASVSARSTGLQLGNLQKVQLDWGFAAEDGNKHFDFAFFLVN